MHSLEEILGQNSIIKTIKRHLENNENQSKVIALKGDSGTGKTYISSKIVDDWKNDEVQRGSLILEGDVANRERTYFPFNFGLLNIKISDGKFINKSISELSKGLPYAGDFVSFLFEYLTKYKTKAELDKLSFLQPQEQDIILKLNSIYRNYELLIIADNFHWWDEPSIKLLDFLLSDKLHNSFPFLKKLKVIIVITTDQVCVSSNVIDEFVKKYARLTVQTTKVLKKDFNKVLSLLGNKNKYSDKAEQLLFSLTNGHIELIKKTSTYFSNEKNAKLLDDDINNPLIKKQNFIEQLLALRLQQLGANAHQVINLLEFASIIGLHFSYEEISCLTKESEEKLREIIINAKENELLKNDSSQNIFSHEIIREFFLTRVGNKKSKYYEKFADCLKLIRPSEYFQRGNLLFEAGLIKEALIVYIIGNLKYLREGITVPAQVNMRIETFLKENDLDNFFLPIKEAYNNFLRSNYEDAIYLIRGIEDKYSSVLIAEKYYLLSLCLAKSLEKQDLSEAKNCLLNWDELKSTESEIWVRIMLTLMSRHAHLNEYDLAATIERKVMLFLSNRTHFDPSAEFGINILRRKASILHISEVACKRTKESLQYFGQERSPGAYYNPIQYYMALSNHSGNLVGAADFESARKYAQEAIALSEFYKEIVFPRIEVPINNFILSGHLSQKLTPQQSINLYNSLFTNLKSLESMVLLRNNFIVITAMNGEIQTAFDLINQLAEKLKSSTRIDYYYNYFIGFNNSVIHYLLGKKKHALKILHEISSQIPDIPDKQFLIKRHQIVEQSFNEINIKDPIIWNEHLLKKYPQEIGPSWGFYGLGFLFSDMQFWSDS